MSENTPAVRASSAPVKPTTVKGWIESTAFRDQVARALPKHLTPDRFLRVALTALLKTPKLATCTPESVTQCLLSCSQMGLEPDGRRAHLIPFEDRKRGITLCTLIIDYKGLVELAMRSGLVSTIHADVVRGGDLFSYNLGTIEAHVPHFLRRDSDKPAEAGPVFAAYALAKMKDGATAAAVLSREEILSIRDASQGWKAFKAGYAKQTPWDPTTPVSEQEMFKKTALRRLTKLLTLSPEFRDAVEVDDEPVDVTPKAAPAPIFRKRDEAPAITLEAPETPNDDGDLGPQPETAPVEVVSPVSPAHQAIAEGLRGASLTFEDFREWARSEGWGFAKDLDAIHDIPERESVKLAKAIGSVVTKIQAGKGAA